MGTSRAWCSIVLLIAAACGESGSQIIDAATDTAVLDGEAVPDATTVLPDAAELPDATTVIPDATTVIPDATTVIPDATTSSPTRRRHPRRHDGPPRRDAAARRPGVAVPGRSRRSDPGDHHGHHR
jgi:hypothetical protein